MTEKQYQQRIKDLQLIKKRTSNNPDRALMCHILYAVRNYLKLKTHTKDLKDMSVSQIISFSQDLKERKAI